MGKSTERCHKTSNMVGLLFVISIMCFGVGFLSGIFFTGFNDPRGLSFSFWWFAISFLFLFATIVVAVCDYIGYKWEKDLDNNLPRESRIDDSILKLIPRDCEGNMLLPGVMVKTEYDGATIETRVVSVSKNEVVCEDNLRRSLKKVKAVS